MQAFISEKSIKKYTLIEFIEISKHIYVVLCINYMDKYEYFQVLKILNFCKYLCGIWEMCV